MIKPDIHTLSRIMVSTLRNMAEDGCLPPGDHFFEDIFGFCASDVDGIHTHKTGAGDGVWFRLKDGRVISAYAEESETDPALYDTVSN